MKKFIPKIFLFLALLGLTQTVLYLSSGGDQQFLPDDIIAYQKMWAKKPNVIYFCDSVNAAIDPEDKNKATISEMMASKLPQDVIGTIEHGSFHMEVYLSFLKNILSTGHHPDFVIVPINLRSFSPGWYSVPGWQFVKIRLLLDYDYFFFRVFFKPLAIFKAFRLTPISETEFRQLPVMDGDQIVGHVEDFIGPTYLAHPERFVKEKFIYNYMYKLTPDHGRVKSMVKLARLAKENNQRIIFYVTPINIEKGDKYLGPRFTERIKENVSVLKSALEKEGVSLVDLSLSLPNSFFMQEKSPAEHLKERGRLYIAGQLAQRIVR